MILFFHNFILRDSCYDCKYANLNRVSDFTLGDFWGLEEFYPDFDDDKGTSVLMLNTRKAQSLFDDIKDDCEFITITKEQVIRRQLNLQHPTKKSNQYNTFWEDYEKNGFEDILRKYADYTFVGQLKRKFLFKFLYYTGIFGLLLSLKNRKRK